MTDGNLVEALAENTRLRAERDHAVREHQDAVVRAETAELAAAAPSEVDVLLDALPPGLRRKVEKIRADLA